MKIRLTPGVQKVGNSAFFPLTHLILSMVNDHPNATCVEIRRDGIALTKGVFFTVSKISFVPYDLECNNGVIIYKGNRRYDIPDEPRAVMLLNTFRHLQPGLISMF